MTIYKYIVAFFYFYWFLIENVRKAKHIFEVNYTQEEIKYAQK